MTTRDGRAHLLDLQEPIALLSSQIHIQWVVHICTQNYIHLFPNLGNIHAGFLQKAVMGISTA